MGTPVGHISCECVAANDLDANIFHCICYLQAGFGHDYQSVKKDVPEYEHLLRVLPRCFTEVMLRVVNPLRPIVPQMFKNGKKGKTHLGLFSH